MSILLTILKIIGIILLIIVGLLFLIVFLLLFVPLRYKLFCIKGLDKKDFKGKITISWLLHIIHASLEYQDKDIILRIRILGIKIKQSSLLKKENPTAITEKPSYTIETADSIDNKKETSADNNKFETDNLEEIVNRNSNESNTDYQELGLTEASNEKYDNTKNSECSINDKTDEINDDEIKAKVTIIDKIKAFINAAYTFTINISNKFGHLCNDFDNKIEQFEKNINNINKEISFYQRFLQDEHNKAAVNNCFKQLKRILKSIKPRKIKGNILFGMEDPASTGQILAIVSVLYPFIYNKVLIDADFENQVLEGDLLLKGKVTIFVLIISAWKVYFNRDLKRLIRIYKKHKNRGVNNKED